MKNNINFLAKKQLSTKLQNSINFKSGGISAYINTPSIKQVRAEMLIKPVKKVDYYDKEGKDKIENWLKMCSIATTILKTSVKGLVNLQVINKMDGIHDMVKAFGQLREYFTKKDNFEEFEAEEKEIDDFCFMFLTSDRATQQRVIKFQESLINKNYKK